MAQTDRRALIALYNATDGANWRESNNWNTDAALKDWYGVKVNGEDRVVKLSLKSNNLRGILRPTSRTSLLALLDCLWPFPCDRKFSLHEVANSTGSHNVIFLVRARLVVIFLADVFPLSPLAVMCTEELGPLRSDCRHCTGETELSTEKTIMSRTIPEEMGKLTALQKLYLSTNKLGGENRQKYKISGAFIFYSPLNSCQLRWFAMSTGTIPEELGNLIALEQLYLGSNNLSGHIPPQLGDLGALEYLSLSNNKLDGESNILEKESRVISIFPANVYYSSAGAIPAQLGALSTPALLDLSYNQLSGERLMEFDASRTYSCVPTTAWAGHILLEGGDLFCLFPAEFVFSRPPVGVIPAQLGQLAGLANLDLSGNELIGEVPRLRNFVLAYALAGRNWLDTPGPFLRSLTSRFSVVLNTPITPHVRAGFWNILGQEGAGSMVIRSGSLPVALASLVDRFDRLERRGGLSLAQNPWEHPPEAVVTGGMRAVRQYFEAIFKGGSTAVTRPLKVVIVGKETIGKTSLRRSIKAGRPCMTTDDGAESTVHVDVEDHDVDGHPIRMFDCAGQAAYYGLLQLFLTPRAVYLLVWDAEKASQMDELNLEDLGIAPWLRQMTFRVPGANLVLVGNKWDRVTEANHHVAVGVERQSHQWLTAWVESAHGHQPPQLTLEAGVSRVSCAPSGRDGWAPSFGARKAWPCDKNPPGERGLLRRIIFNPDDDTRAVTMRLPPGYVLALNWLEELSRSRNEAGQKHLVIKRAKLEEEWKIRVHALDTAGTTVAASEAAMSGAILIRKWEGGLVEYGDFIFLDVGWFADVLDPLFSHKRDSNGIIDLGGKTVKNVESLKRLDTDHIFEPALAEDLWGAELAPHLLSALDSAGLTFPIPNDPGEGLAVVLRMDTEPPPDHRVKVEEVQSREHFDLRLKVQCPFSLGLPPGFVERLLARCCHLGFPHPFWRYGALVVGDGAEERSFSLTLEYSEEEKTLEVEVNGRCGEVHAWATLSKVLSVTMKMLSEFPGLPCQPEFFCPRHESKGMRISKANTQPGCRLVDEGHFCPICPDRTAGKDLLGVALQVVEFSDTEFSDTELRKQFADHAERMAREGRALWPALETEVGPVTVNRPSQFFYHQCVHVPCAARIPVNTDLNLNYLVPAPTQISPGHQVPATNPIRSCCQVLKTLGHKDVETWIGTASAACLAVFGVFAGRDDDEPRLWGVFLGFGLLFLMVVLIQIVLRVSKLNSPSEAAGGENEHDVETPTPFVIREVSTLFNS
ncbi:unnamed protein product [Scytosiphon promiscuus]